MKFFKVVLSCLLVASPLMVSASEYSVYYEEFKALKNAPKTKVLFEQDVDGGSHTNQCNLEMYRPFSITPDNIEDLGSFTNLDLTRRALSLGTIQRNIAMGKALSLFNQVLQIGLCDINADLIIVTPQTMPSLYNYVNTLSKKAKIQTPVVFISLKEGFFKTFSRKILMFAGSIVIGQRVLHDVSDEELEALVAQQVGHIKYNHYNQTYLLQAAASWAVFNLVCDNNKSICNNRLFAWFIVPALTTLLIGKRFEKQVDKFVCKHAGKSNGIIAFYERLQGIDQARAAEFDTISRTIKDNAANLPILTYIVLMMHYYFAKAEDCVTKVYNKFAYPSYQSRIDAANDFLSQQEA